MNRACFTFCCLLAASAQLAAEPTRGDSEGFGKVVAPFLRQHCVSCHGADKPKAELRLDTLDSGQRTKREAVETWKLVLNRLEAGDMPPKEKPHPKPEQVQRVVRWVRAELKQRGVKAIVLGDLAFPQHGNAIDHDLLFGNASQAHPATPSRIWRLSPFAYSEFVGTLTGDRGIGKNKKEGKQIVLPFGLTNDPGFRDYAFRYTVTGSETEQMVLNAKRVIEYLLVKRPRRSASYQTLTVIADSTSAPSPEQIQAAVSYMFRNVLFREPTPEELARYGKFLTRGIERFGDRKGLVHGLTPVLLHPEAVFRIELGEGKPDEYGRVLLAPLELALAISYALTDDRPDAPLMAAVRGGKLTRRIVGSGDAKLVGPVKNAVAMIGKLAQSQRVEQVFVRHAFRYWLGRNETVEDAPTLQAAHEAYKKSNGSMKALLTALLTSDSFLYRIASERMSDAASIRK